MHIWNKNDMIENKAKDNEKTENEIIIENKEIANKITENKGIEYE